jgi:glutamate-1-semialdehyde 2,1-aminomutase
MSAIRLARGVTGRDRIIKFAGCYHGHADHLLVAAGSGLTTFGQPDSAGVPTQFASLTQVLDLDDEDALEAAFSREGEQIAAVIIEPLPANHGLLVQRREFLETLRDLTTRHGALLIFDEVISGFRLGPDGAAGRYEVTPDLVTFGKVIGGGLPVGAFAGRHELMDELAPLGPVYQAGTLSGNPVAMAAGLSTLRVLETSDGWRKLEALGQALEARLGPVLEASRLPLQLVREGSIFWLCTQTGPAPRSPLQFDPNGADRYREIFHALIERGVYLAPSAFEVGFLSLAHQESHIDDLAASLEEALAEAGRHV